MVYAGPTEVIFHAKSRRSAGASYFVVGRDPAGMKGSSLAVAHKDDDLYDGDHGRYVLRNSPGLGAMKMLSFVKVMYDIRDNVMKVPDDNRPSDFISISGSKMRLLARNGAVPCSPTDIPTDLVEANCVPSGFMVPKGWEIVVDYYRNIEAGRWIPWSRPVVDPGACKSAEGSGKFGTLDFQLKPVDYESFWHDIPMKPSSGEEYIINLVTEIPLRMTAKMEVQKALPGNPIGQDVNKDGSPDTTHTAPRSSTTATYPKRGRIRISKIPWATVAITIRSTSWRWDRSGWTWAASPLAASSGTSSSSTRARWTTRSFASR